MKSVLCVLLLASFGFLIRVGPKQRVNIKMLHPGLKVQDEGHSRNHALSAPFVYVVAWAAMEALNIQLKTMTAGLHLATLVQGKHGSGEGPLLKLLISSR